MLAKHNLALCFSSVQRSKLDNLWIDIFYLMALAGVMIVTLFSPRLIPDEQENVWTVYIVRTLLNAFTAFKGTNFYNFHLLLLMLVLCHVAAVKSITVNHP